MESYAETKQKVDNIINKMTMEELEKLLEYLKEQRNKGE